MSRGSWKPPIAPGFPPAAGTGKMPPMPMMLPPGFIPPPGGFGVPPFSAPPPGFPVPPAGWPIPLIPTGIQPPTISPGTSSDNSKAKTGSASDWDEYEDSTGQPYWYNRVTLVSSWDKPEELKSEFEKEETTDWKEYTDEEGRKYYFNAKTEETTWILPESYRAFLERIEERKRMALETPTEKMLRSVFPEEQAKNKFARLLIERHMQSNWTWEQCVSATFEDDRSKALKMAERKQVYQLMVQKLKVFEEDERRRKDRQLFSQFHSMLDSWTEMDRYTTFRELTEKFSDNPALTNIASEKERIHMFNDYKKAKERKQAEKLRLETEHNLDSFKDYLRSARLTTDCSWKTFCETHPSAFEKFVLEPVDRIQAFLEHMRELEKADDDQAASERRMERIVARKTRESYRSLLLEKFSMHSHMPSSSLSSSMQLDWATPWHSFLPLIAQEPRYLAMLNTTGSTPAELFYDYTTELQEKYAKEKRKLKNLVRSLGVRVLRFSLGSHELSDSQLDQRPENILSLSFEDAPKLEFKSWMQRFRQHLPTLEEHSIRRIYREFGTRELSKMQSRLRRAQRHLFDALKPKLGDPQNLLSFTDAKILFDLSPESSILTEQEKEFAYQEAIRTLQNPEYVSPLSQRGLADANQETSSGLEEKASTHSETASENIFSRRKAKRSRAQDDSDASSSDSESHTASDAAPSRKMMKREENQEDGASVREDTVALPPWMSSASKG